MRITAERKIIPVIFHARLISPLDCVSWDYLKSTVKTKDRQTSVEKIR